MRPPDLTAVFVHYRTPDLLGRALEAMRADASATGVGLELVVVDNGSEANDRSEWAADARNATVRWVDPGANLGYAGGVNAGVAIASGPRLLLSNPDARVRPGALRALVEALGRADIAGPRFVLDEEERVLLPPAEKRSRIAELLAALAPPGSAAERVARGAWRRQARRHWRAKKAIPSFDLSGGLLAVRRSAWNELGPFDESFRLYFEETDWLRRARRAGLSAVYEPRAVVVHEVGRSTAREAQAAAWFEESAARFRRKHFGPAFAHVLEKAAARSRTGGSSGDRAPADFDGGGLSEFVRDGAWLEASPLPRGFPAVGMCVEPGDVAASFVHLTEELRRRGDREPWYLCATDERGRELRRARYVVAASEESS